ncbi:MAG: PAS domain S-box protein [Pelovirga sp.]
MVFRCAVLWLLLFGVPLAGAAEDTFGLGSGLFRDHAVVMLLIEPASGAIVDANPAAVAYYGYARAQLLQMTIQQINIFALEQVEQEYRLAAREKRSYFQFQHRLANGMIRFVDVFSSPVVVAGRTLLLSMIHDVESRNRLQASVVASETRLRFAEQVAKLGHWTLDLETGTYEFSDGAQALLGWHSATMDTQSFRTMIAPEDLPRMDRLRQAQLAGRADYSVNVRFKRPDGLLIDLHTEGRYDPATNTMFGVIHDMTDYQQALRTLSSRTVAFFAMMTFALLAQLGIIVLLVSSARRRRKAEAALRESKQRLDQLAQQNRTIVWETDAQGRYTFVSDVIREVLGYEPEEVIGQLHFYDWHPDAGREAFKSAALGVFARREEFNRQENPIVTRDGKALWVATSGLPMVDAQNNLLGYRGIDVDITDRKRAQFDLEEKNREIEEFTDIVCHDLKSPLVTIASFLPILKQDIAAADTEQIRADLAYIEGATTKMEQLLDALQQLCQVGRGKNTFVRLAPGLLIDDCLASLAGPLRQRQIRVRVEDLPLQLHGDALQFGQIWQNLIENAIKYMGDQQAPEIVLGVEVAREGAVFYVRDNGMGIEPRHAERIFNLFSQLNPRSDGRGLGLGLVKKIVERYRGRIWVESQGLGEGSCFRFTLPAAVNDQGEPS